MSEVRIDGLGPVRYTPLGKPAPAAAPGVDFKESLKSALEQANELQLHAADQVERLVAGEQVDLHEVMISSEEAAIAFELMLEIRNKLVEAYQELQRMHV
jgi:flagellar hook-basal body complex protein FliE